MIGPSCCGPRPISPNGSFTSILACPSHVRFSNRVKPFQTIHHYSVDVARGLVLLFGIGTKAYSAPLPLDERQVQAGIRSHLIHRPARDIIPPLDGARVSSYR